MIARIKRAVRRVARLLGNPPPVEAGRAPGLPEHNFDPDSFLVDQATSTVRLHPSSAARFWPMFGNQTSWMIPKPAAALEHDPTDGLPVPPPELWAGYGSTPEMYVASGREHYESMMRGMAGVGFTLEAGRRVLDLGCAAGRMTRCFRPSADKVQVWGVDQSAKHVFWCQQNLSPPCKFVTCTTFPHLPFEDNYFDFIFAGSVFTHIGDLEDAWLMELRRITRPQGKLYITVADERTVEIVLSSPPGHWLHDTALRRQLLDFQNEHHFVDSGFQLIMTAWAPGNGQVVHGRQYIQKQWGCYFDVLAVVPEAYGYQTAVVLRKSDSF